MSQNFNFKQRQKRHGGGKIGGCSVAPLPRNLTSEPICCLFCEATFLPAEDPTYSHLLAHLVSSHKFVIADMKLIADMRSYLKYWRKRFEEDDITNFCSIIRTNSAAADKEDSEDFYLLCDALPEDRELREKLQQKRLEYVLEVQQQERTDTSFSRDCLFCKKHFEGHLHELFDHMTSEHHVNIGQPDNIVFGNELLDLIEEKLHKFQCLFCEKEFKDWAVLKEHMRKKQHKRINPKNMSYDKFYIINYLELGKNWEAVQAESDAPDPSAMGEDEWKDWEEEGPGAKCLFCDTTSLDLKVLLEHMKEIHSFDFHEVKTKLQLSFYKQVKLVNFIRRRVNQQGCIACEEKFETQQALLSHMTNTNHISSPDPEMWDQPEYFFPTYEDDRFLCGLDDDVDEGQPEEDVVVVPEPVPIKTDSSVLHDEHLRKSIA